MILSRSLLFSLLTVRKHQLEDLGLQLGLVLGVQGGVLVAVALLLRKRRGFEEEEER
jgi:hypothetical protein